MAYLHSREYIDEADQNKMKRCILHRDLKVALNRLTSNLFHEDILINLRPFVFLTQLFSLSPVYLNYRASRTMFW